MECHWRSHCPTMLFSNCQAATVDRPGRAVHVAGRVRCEKDDDAGHFLRLAEPAAGIARQESLLDGLRIFTIRPFFDCAPQRRVNWTGTHGVDADAELAHFAR